MSDAPPSPAAPSSADGTHDDRRAVRLTQIALVVVALVVVGLVLVTRGSSDDGSPSGSSAADERPAGDEDAKRTWPSETGGRPPGLGERGQGAAEVTLAGDVEPGVYLWSDFDGWHLWVVGGPAIPALQGTMSSNDAIARADLAVAGVGNVAVADKVATFDLPTGAPIVGIDFNPGFFADQLAFTLEGPEGAIDPTLVRLGSKAGPAPFPLVLSKS
ncbi:MAG: hypothetical protein R2702_14635 [Acidimicrobiales bacterium]